MVSDEHDVLIVGAGPAGCAAACLLARWGHSVRLVGNTEPAARSLAESIPPSCRKLFAAIGVLDRLDSAGFVRSTGNTVWWGDDSPRIETFAEGERGWQVSDTALRAILIDAATAAGADLVTERLASIPVAAHRFVLDCSGRTGVLARARRLRVYEQQQRTVALVANWAKQSPWAIPDQTHTLIESYVDGWAWSVPLRSARAIAVMVDPHSTNLARSQSPRDVYLAELAKTRHLAALARDATLDDGPWGWDASLYHASHYVDDNVLLVGDAASFIDPLSSAGVKKALASGWLAAVAVHTALVRPSMRDVALEFYAAREIEMYGSFRRLTERYMSAAADRHGHPFWTDRAGETETVAETSDAAVTEAFLRIKAAPRLSLRLADNVRIEPRPAISGSEIVWESRLVTPAMPQGIRYLDDVDVVALVELAPSQEQAPDLFEALNRRVGPIALDRFLRVLSTAVANHWLVSGDPGPPPD